MKIAEVLLPGMRKLFLKQILLFGIFLLVVFVPFSAVLAACEAGYTAGAAAGTCIPSGTGLSDMTIYDFLVRLMNWLLGIIGILGVIAFVISGVQYLTSAGNEEMAKSAKQNMTYAVVGLVVALAGLIVVNAIAGLTGAGSVTNY